MNFKFRVITANCGNDAIGSTASVVIATNLIADDADFYVINCQEVAFDKTLQQLQEAVGPDYTVAISDKMTTHTKLSTQFHSDTGIASFVIHKKNLKVDLAPSQLARRNTSRLTVGSGYNKGGLITDIVITSEKENIKVQTVSGHLDSEDIKSRSNDWYSLNQKLAKEVSNWDELVRVIPHLRLSGYDANTRNKLNAKTSSNLWLTPSAPELQALYQASLAGQHFSRESTYKTNQDNISQLPDKKRPGYAKGGMLDFVGVANGRDSSTEITQEEVIKIGLEEGTERDHDVILSPLQQYETFADDFDLVKGQIAIRLARIAPELTKEIIGLDKNDINKARLLQVYQLFLRPRGLLNHALVQRFTDSVLL